ncbi:MAG: DUF4832 domain-containing protein [Planctomycetaceae bacterium]
MRRLFRYLPPTLSSFGQCVFALISAMLLIELSAASAQTTLEYVPAAVDNPLKGLVPYSGDKRDRFPHSLEFNYLSLSSLMTGMQEFQWEPLEKLLNDVAGRGHQTVFRVWMVYPGHDDGIPEFLVKDGLKVTTWLNTNTAPFPAQNVHTPDYNDPRMRRALQNFIAALGKKYDGDPRIGFITAGLLGTWGEWHEYPRDDLFASRETQTEVLDAFTAAFSKTPVLLRYPAGDDHWHYAANHKRPFGYHDDSFAWATLDTGRRKDDWFYMPSLKAAGPAAMDRWKTHPIGGEIRPELWGKIFDKTVRHNQAQDITECIRQTHVTWLMDTGMSEKKQSAVRIANASKAVQQMGYEFHITTAQVRRAGSDITATVRLKNTAVAPFYYDWKIVVGAIDSDGRVLREWPTDWALTQLLPDAPEREWSTMVPVDQIPQNTTWLGLRVVNPLPNGLPLRFANSPDRQQADGWFRIGRLP